jgi:hypothetical protein
MKNPRKRMVAAVFLAGLFGAHTLLAWGPEGHRVVGALALNHMAAEPRLALEQIMDGSDPAELNQWCNWPDEYRATDEGAWTAPMHYINMVPGEGQYRRERDCADRMCVTEAIRKYAAVLGDVTLSDQRRREAFGYLCHFVGDLSQPLHAGFGHDRGGNDFAIRFHGEDLNLHELWDHSLIELHTDSWEALYAIVHQQPFSVDATPWNPNEVVDWTNTSHAIAAECAYPDDPEISEAFAQSSWSMIQSQLARGGVNLARVLNTVLALENGSAR